MHFIKVLLKQEIARPNPFTDLDPKPTDCGKEKHDTKPPSPRQWFIVVRVAGWWYHFNPNRSYHLVQICSWLTLCVGRTFYIGLSAYVLKFISNSSCLDQLVKKVHFKHLLSRPTSQKCSFQILSRVKHVLKTNDRYVCGS